MVGTPNYRQIARDKATEYGLDPDIIERQFNQESGFNPNAKSPVGAIGIAQLMPNTAKSLGVDPNDPIQNIEGGIKYMSQKLKQYNGDYKLALAAYNGGDGGADYLRRNPQYFDAPDNSADPAAWKNQTANYVKKILGNNSNTPQAKIQPTPEQLQEVRQKPYDPTLLKDLYESWGLGEVYTSEMANIEGQLAKQTNWTAPEVKIPSVSNQSSNIPDVSLTVPTKQTTPRNYESVYSNIAREEEHAKKLQDLDAVNQTATALVAEGGRLSSGFSNTTQYQMGRSTLGLLTSMAGINLPSDEQIKIGLRQFSQDHPNWNFALKNLGILGSTVLGGARGAAIGTPGGPVGMTAGAFIGGGTAGTAFNKAWSNLVEGRDTSVKEDVSTFLSSGLPMGSGTLFSNLALKGGLSTGSKIAFGIVGGTDDAIKSISSVAKLPTLGRFGVVTGANALSNVAFDAATTPLINMSGLPGDKLESNLLLSAGMGAALGGAAYGIELHAQSSAVKKLESLKTKSDLPPSTPVSPDNIIPDEIAAGHARTVEITNAQRLQNPQITNMDDAGIKTRISEIDSKLAQAGAIEPTSPQHKVIKKYIKEIDSAEAAKLTAESNLAVVKEQLRTKPSVDPMADAKKIARLEAKVNESVRLVEESKVALYDYYDAEFVSKGIQVDDYAKLEQIHREAITESSKKTSTEAAPKAKQNPELEQAILERNMLEVEFNGRQSEQALVLNEQARAQAPEWNDNQLVYNMHKMEPNTLEQVQAIKTEELKGVEDARAVGAIENYLQDIETVRNADRDFVTNLTKAFANDKPANGLTRSDMVGIIRNLPEDHPDRATAVAVGRLLTGAYGSFKASPELQAKLKQINPDVFEVTDHGEIKPAGVGTLKPEEGIVKSGIRETKDNILTMLETFEDVYAMDHIAKYGNFNFTNHPRFGELKSTFATKIREVLPNLDETQLDGVSTVASSLALAKAKRAGISVEDAVRELQFTGNLIEGLYQTIQQAKPEKISDVLFEWNNYKRTGNVDFLESTIAYLNKHFNAQIVLHSADPILDFQAVYIRDNKTIITTDNTAITHELAHEFNNVLQAYPKLLDDLNSVITPIFDIAPKAQAEFIKYYQEQFDSMRKAGMSETTASQIANATVLQELHSEWYSKKAGKAVAYEHARDFLKVVDQYPELKATFEETFIKEIDQAFQLYKVENQAPQRIIDEYYNIIDEAINKGIVENPILGKVSEKSVLLQSFRETYDFATADPYLSARKDAATQPTSISGFSEQIGKTANEMAAERIAAKEGKKQVTGEKILGAFDPNTNKIYLSKDANVFTIVHELAHWFESALSIDERAAILKWAKQSEWDVNTSEKFARGFEVYMSDKRNAPSSFLRKTFQAFANWGHELLVGMFGERLDGDKLNKDVIKVYKAIMSEASPRAYAAAKEVASINGKLSSAPVDMKPALQLDLIEAKQRQHIAEAADALERNFNIKISEEGFFQPSAPEFNYLNLNLVAGAEKFLNRVFAQAHPGEWVDFTTGLPTTFTQITTQVNAFENRFKDEATKLINKLSKDTKISAESLIATHPDIVDAIVRRNAMNEATLQLEKLREAGYNKSLSTEWQIWLAMFNDRYALATANSDSIKKTLDNAIRKQLKAEGGLDESTQSANAIKYITEYLIPTGGTRNLGQRNVTGVLLRPAEGLIRALRDQANDHLGINPFDHLVNKHNWSLAHALISVKDWARLQLTANVAENTLATVGYVGLRPDMMNAPVVQFMSGLNRAIQSSQIGTQTLNAIQSFVNSGLTKAITDPRVIQDIPGARLSKDDQALLQAWGYKVINQEKMMAGNIFGAFENWGLFTEGGFSGMGMRGAGETITPMGKIQTGHSSVDLIAKLLEGQQNFSVASLRFATAYEQQRIAENALVATKEHLKGDLSSVSEQKARETFNYFYSKLADEGKAGLRGFLAPSFTGDAALVDPRAWGITMDRMIEGLYGNNLPGQNPLVSGARKITAMGLGAAKEVSTRFTGWWFDETSKVANGFALAEKAFKEAPNAKVKARIAGVVAGSIITQAAIFGAGGTLALMPFQVAYNVLNAIFHGDDQEKEAAWQDFSALTMAYPGWKQEGFQRMSGSKFSYNPLDVLSILATNRDPIKFAIAAGYLAQGKGAEAFSVAKKTLPGSSYANFVELTNSFMALGQDDGKDPKEKLADVGYTMMKVFNKGIAEGAKQAMALESGYLSTSSKTKPSNILSNSVEGGVTMSPSTYEHYQKNLFWRMHFLFTNSVLGMRADAVEQQNRENAMQYAQEDPIAQLGLQASGLFYD